MVVRGKEAMMKIMVLPMITTFDIIIYYPMVYIHYCAKYLPQSYSIFWKFFPLSILQLCYSFVLSNTKELNRVPSTS